MPAGIEGSPTEAEVAMAYCQDKDTGASSSGEYSLAWALLEVTIFLPRGSSLQVLDASG